jgi:hypothetical protein
MIKIIATCQGCHREAVGIKFSRATGRPLAVLCHSCNDDVDKFAEIQRSRARKQKETWKIKNMQF